MNRKLLLPLALALLLTGCAQAPAEESAVEEATTLAETEPVTEVPTEPIPATEPPTDPATERRRPDIPLLEEIAAMTGEEALEVLAPYTWDDLREAWGKESWSYSGRFGAGWETGHMTVAVEFGGEGVREVLVYNISDALEERAERERLTEQLTPVVEEATQVEDVLAQIRQGTWECPILAVEVQDEIGIVLTTGALRGVGTRYVDVRYGTAEKEHQLRLEVPKRTPSPSEQIITCDADMIADGASRELSIPELPKTFRMYRDRILDGEKTVISGGVIKRLVLADMNEDDKRGIIALLEKDDGSQFVMAYDVVNEEPRMYVPERRAEYELITYEDYEGCGAVTLRDLDEGWKIALENVMGYVG